MLRFIDSLDGIDLIIPLLLIRPATDDASSVSPAIAPIEGSGIRAGIAGSDTGTGVMSAEVSATGSGADCEADGVIKDEARFLILSA